MATLFRFVNEITKKFSLNFELLIEKNLIKDASYPVKVVLRFGQGRRKFRRFMLR